MVLPWQRSSLTISLFTRSCPEGWRQRVFQRSVVPPQSPAPPKKQRNQFLHQQSSAKRSSTERGVQHHQKEVSSKHASCLCLVESPKTPRAQRYHKVYICLAPERCAVHLEPGHEAASGDISGSPDGHRQADCDVRHCSEEGGTTQRVPINDCCRHFPFSDLPVFPFYCPPPSMSCRPPFHVSMHCAARSP